MNVNDLKLQCLKNLTSVFFLKLHLIFIQSPYWWQKLNHFRNLVKSKIASSSFSWVWHKHFLAKVGNHKGRYGLWLLNCSLFYWSWSLASFPIMCKGIMFQLHWGPEFVPSIPCCFTCPNNHSASSSLEALS